MATDGSAVGSGLLADRVAFVTGAARGIGRAIAERYVKEGAVVVLGDVDTAALQSAVDEISPDGAGASGVAVDVTSQPSLEAALAACLQRHGRVDVVVANVGILYLSHVLSTPLERWQRTLDVNLTGAFLTCQVFGRQLVKQGPGGGRIILTSSLFGLRGGVENGAYSASKFGVIGLMQCLAAELAPHNILVNAVCPGQVDTDMMRMLFQERSVLRGESEAEVRSQLKRRVPLGRLASVAEIADVYVFLASALNRYVTGQSLVADGGWTVGPN